MRRARGKFFLPAAALLLAGCAAAGWRKPGMTGESYLRDTDTMPGWAGSCWYYLRFMDAHNAEAFAS